MPATTFVLLESMDANAPVYQTTPDKQRVQIKKIPVHRPYLRVTYQDEKGKGVTLRYKSRSNSVFQDFQIKEEKIEANERFTTQEYRDPEFRFGILVVPEQKKILKEFLLTHPECLGFKGICDDVKEPKYRLLDKAVEDKIKNSDIRKRLQAANKIMSLDLVGAQEMLIRLNGFRFETPTELEECQNLLMAFLDDSEEPGLDAILLDEENINIDDQTTILIGKLINAGTLSFDAVDGKISKKDKNDNWVTIRDMSNEYSVDERKRLFSDFLNSSAGKLLKDDLENDLDDEYEDDDEDQNEGENGNENEAPDQKPLIKKSVIRRKKRKVKKIVQPKP